MMVDIDLGYIKTILSHAAAVHGVDVSTEPIDLTRIALRVQNAILDRRSSGLFKVGSGQPRSGTVNIPLNPRMLRCTRDATGPLELEGPLCELQDAAAFKIRSGSRGNSSATRATDELPNDSTLSDSSFCAK